MRSAATNTRNFRSFLLMSQLQAREIGGRIKQKRVARGMTQEELASMASFSARSLQDYENGVTIPYRHFQEIGRLLDATPEFLMYGRDDQPADEPPSQPSTRDLLEGIAIALAELADGQREIVRLLHQPSTVQEPRAVAAPRRKAAPKRQR